MRVADEIMSDKNSLSLSRGVPARASGGRGELWEECPSDDPFRGSNLAVPDILHEKTQAWTDLASVAGLVRFAFEGGECTEIFDELVRATPLSPSNWHAETFAGHLFLDDLIRTCFPLEIDGIPHRIHEAFLVRALSHPPSNPADTRVRQEVFSELLEQPVIRSDLERVYRAVARLRSHLDSTLQEEPEPIARKLEILRAVQACVEALAEGFGQATSLLSRLREAGQRMRGSQGYERLRQLLDLEGNLATVDVRLRLGADGHVRELALRSVKENEQNPLLPSVWQRVWQRLMAVVRGHRYGQREIVVSLFHEVFSSLVDTVVVCLALVGPMQFYLAGLGFRDRSTRRGFSVCLPEIVDAACPSENRVIERVLEGVFNPLLELQGVEPRPVDVRLGCDDALVLLTGPNSGGKTRLLQAVGLVQCLGQGGVFVPASRARLIRAPTLFVSLVDEVDVAQTEGRLGTELVRIRRLFEELQPASMALIDELCSGTNPTEGEEIARVVISLLPRLRPQVFISTHYLGMAQQLERERPVRGLAFLEVELDGDNQPTYRFVPGVAKTSLAHLLAERLGVTREALERIVAEKIGGWDAWAGGSWSGKDGE
ncbi:MAG: Endonuclease MutS2 [Deltaproteobacteria bacterium ADurb.Bin207]|jgi:DNA mismatch repair protein MutS2|nr:MAG: Endonuclease MutS2 [Deltaproteobacteria bacterium ADurb.Bin207]